MNMIQTIREGAARQKPRLEVAPCPFCNTDPGLPVEMVRANLFVIACENDECGVSVQATGRTTSEALERWNRRAA